LALLTGALDHEKAGAGNGENHTDGLRACDLLAKFEVEDYTVEEGGEEGEDGDDSLVHAGHLGKLVGVGEEEDLGGVGVPLAKHGNDVLPPEVSRLVDHV